MKHLVMGLLARPSGHLEIRLQQRKRVSLISNFWDLTNNSSATTNAIGCQGPLGCPRGERGRREEEQLENIKLGKVEEQEKEEMKV